MHFPLTKYAPPSAIVLSCAGLVLLSACKSDVTSSSISVPAQQKTEQIKAPASTVNKGTVVLVSDTESSKVTGKTAQEKATPDPQVAKPTPSKKAEKIVPEKITKPIKKAPAPAPNIKFANIRHDFGTITEGDIINYKFEFTNSGNSPLIIVNTNVTCGCTVPSYPFVPIEPGETGHIGVRYNSVGKMGEQKPLITINTNASKEPVTLMLYGTVEEKGKGSDSLAQTVLSTITDSLALDTLKGK